MARQTSTKAAINMIAIHRAQTKAIFDSNLDDNVKILVLKQLNISCEMLLIRENCYFGYIMPEHNEAIDAGNYDDHVTKPSYYMHHYEARVKVSA